MSDMTSIPAAALTQATAAKKTNAKLNISPADQRRLNEATADFEAMFIQQLFKSMRQTVPEDPHGGLFAKSQGEKIFAEMLDAEYAKNMSRGHSGLGLKEAIFKQTVSRQLAQGVQAQDAVNLLRGSENSLNALQQSPIGKKGMARGELGPLDQPESGLTNVSKAASKAGKTDKSQPVGPE
ncbi:MAG: rod-binding protein [Magnetococcus sp. YQC-5]